MSAPVRTTRRFRRPRGAAWTVAVFVAVAATLAHTARAHVDELALGAGAAMLRYAGADQVDAERTLVVNGLRIHVSSGGTKDAPREVLDFFHARCRERGIRFDARAATGRRAARLPPWAGGLPLDGVLRLDDGERGYVACLDLGGRHLSPDELLQRTRRFLAEGDLAHVGGLRFAAVERHAERTSYVAIWTEGSLPLWRAFPPDRDAPGKDLAAVPRVPGTRRVLSAWQVDAAPMLAVYHAEATTAQVLAGRYRRSLEAAGFQVRASGANDRSLVASRGGGWCLIVFADDGSGAAAAVTPF